MKKFLRFEYLAVTVGVALLTLLVFRQYFFGHKTLFPSNLLVSTYAPWKYEPVSEYPNGPPNTPIGFDNARQFFPNRQLLKESLQKGIVPLWNPYIYSGTPFMGAFDTSVWYPISWIAAILPTVEGWNFLVIIQPILSLLFMYVFLKSMKFDPGVAAYGAFVWAFSGFMVVYWQEILVLEHSFLWLPLALYGSNRLKENQKDRKDRIGFGLLVLALTCSVFGGFLQMSIYVYLMVILWGMNRRIFTAVLLSLFIAAIQIIPSAEAYLLSPRGAADGLKTFQNALLPFQHLITLIAPDFWGNPATYNYFGGAGFYFEKMIYIGVIPLILAIYAMGERKNKRILFWTLTAIVALSLGFVIPTSWLPYILHAPVLSNSYPTRVFGIWAFASTVLSCFGISLFIRKPNYKRFAFVVGVVTVVLLLGWAVVAAAWGVGKTSMFRDLIGYIPAIYKAREWYATVSLRNLILPTVFVLAGWALIILRKFSGKLVFVFIGVAVAASGLYFAQKYVYFSERRFVYPDLAVTREITAVAGYDRVWGYGHAFLEKNIAQYYGWFSTDGYGNLSPGRYAELLSTIVNGGRLGGTIRRSDVDIYEDSEGHAMNSNPYRLRMMSLLGVRYILEAKVGEPTDKDTTEERFPASLFSIAWQNDTWRLWQYAQALPRVIFATNYAVRNRPQDIVDALYDPQINLGDTVILEKDSGKTLTAVNPAKTRADIISYDLNTVGIRTDSGADGFIVLTDNYYPGWSVYVDGKPEILYPADYAFKAVFVPRGTHTVVFQYMPPSIIIGGVVTLGGIIAFVTLLIFTKRRRTST